MHEHDQDLIMALAEKSLAPDAAAAAEAALEACPECRRDLELQRVALEAVREAAPVYMTAAESTALHERLHHDLKLASPSAERPHHRPAWVRLTAWAAGAAAVFLAIVALAPVFGNGGDAGTEAAAAATTAAAFEPTSPSPGGATANDEMLDLAQSLPAEDGAETGGAEMAATETTAAAAETVTTAPSRGVLEIVATGDLDETMRRRFVEDLATNTESYSARTAAVEIMDTDFAACLEEDAIPDASDGFEPPPGSDLLALGIIEGNDGKERLLVAYVTADVNDSVLAAVSVPSCEVYQTVP
jgi:hypothetical protein